MSLTDLRNGEIHAVALYHPQVAVSRTAYEDGLGGANNAHDANFLTLHRFTNFRDLTLEDSVIELHPDEVREAGMEPVCSE